MRQLLFSIMLVVTIFCGRAQMSSPSIIEVTGSATLNIVPDRITIEIGMEEYFSRKESGDSVLVRMPKIENDVRKVLHSAGVPDSMIIVSDIGNYRNGNMPSTFLMAKRLSATVSDFNQIEKISERLDRKGIVSFNIIKSDNSDISRYNSKGLKAALDVARQKAEFIAESEGMKLLEPLEIVETTNEPTAYLAFSNVSYNQGEGMENMRRIVRRYSVKVRYRFTK